MTTFLVFFAVLTGAIFFHELGHAIAMRECGVRIKLFVIGVPLRFLTWSVRSKRLGHFFGDGFVFQLSPLLLGGAVVQHEDGAKRMQHELTYVEHSYICGAGPLWNLLCITVVFAFLFLYTAVVRGTGWFEFGHGFLRLSYSELAMVMTATSVLCWIFRRFVCAVLLPILGIMFLVQFLHSLAGGLIQQVWESGNFAYMGKEAAGVGNTLDFMKFWAFINFALFLFNILPLYPLDGGQIVDKMFERLSEKGAVAFRLLGYAFVASLIALVLAADLNKLVQAVF